jgi:hemin uptake protein HemP
LPQKTDSEIQSQCTHDIGLFQPVKLFSGTCLKMAKGRKNGDPAGSASIDNRAESAASPPAPPLEINSEALLGGRTEVRIRHRGEIYRLTLTRAGKLILHK